jgi:hypothetical protein
MAKMGPKPSPNPGRTARFYRKNKKSREKHVRDETERNRSPEKRRYRNELLQIRKDKKPGSQQDVSHKPGGGTKIESRKSNRARGGAKRK